MAKNKQFRRKAYTPASANRSTQNPFQVPSANQFSPSARVSSPNTFMGPNTPLHTILGDDQATSVRGRQYDYPIGANLKIQPRADELISYQQMRALADTCDLLRIVIEKNKNEICKARWGIRYKDSKKKPDSRCMEIHEFLQLPDKEHTWDDWLRQLLEEMYVVDAACIYPWMQQNKPYRLDLIDGTTIRRNIDELGRTPIPPDAAYQQVIKGLPAVDYMATEIVFAPRNRRVYKLFGYSPVEQVIVTINTAIRRSIFQLSYYTEGSKPDLLFTCPEDWQMSQIRDFNDYWNDLLAGKLGARRQAQFLPSGMTPVETKKDILKDEYDEWMARIICFAFGVSANPFIKQNNRSTSETDAERAIRDGLMPSLQWIKSVMDRIIFIYWQATDIEFWWEPDQEISPVDQAGIDDTNLRNGSVLINEVRARRGDDPVEGGDRPMVLTASGYVPITPADPAIEEGGDVSPGALPLENEEPASGEDSGNESKDKDRKDKKPPAKAKQKAKNKGFRKGGADDENEEELEQPKKKLREHLAEEAAIAAALLEWFTSQIQIIAILIYERKIPADALGVGDVDALEGVLRRNLTEIYKLTSKDAVEEVSAPKSPSSSTPPPSSSASPSAATRAETVNAQMDELVSKTLAQSTLEMIRGEIAEAVSQNMPVEDIVKLLVDSYALSDARAKVIAGTEVSRLQNGTALAVYRASGILKKQWIVKPDCCDSCLEVADEIALIDELFSNGLMSPPEHPNCRCVIGPITKGM